MSLRSSRSLLALVVLLSLVARLAWLGAPCHGACRRPTDHVLIFDETYYVNAARVIAGIHPPAGDHYASAPLGDDPNSEHPQGVKLVMAGLIELLGDGPLAWRLGSVIAGTLALLGMWALARAAGAREGVAVAAAALMAADNLLLVAGRIGTLDIYAVAAMVWAGALYLRGRWIAAGAVLAVGIAAKETAVLGLVVLGLYEVLGCVAGRGRRAGVLRGLGTAAVALGGFVGLLAGMDAITPPWNPGTGRLVGGVLAEIRHIIGFGAGLRSPHGPQGIASYPWDWLVDVKPIVYLSIDPSQPAPGLTDDHPRVLFLGMVSPPVLLAGLVGLLCAIWLVTRRRDRHSLVVPTRVRAVTAALEPQRRLLIAGLAWFLGTWAPYAILSGALHRTTYLYYMVEVMPGLYLTGAALGGVLRGRRWWLIGFGVTVAAAAVLMYPFVPVL